MKEHMKGNKGAYALREVTCQDYDFVYDVKKITLKPYIEEIWGWDDRVQKKFCDEGFEVETHMIITYDGEDIGILETNELESRIEIVELQILPKYQGKGIGTSILKDIIEKYKGTSKRIGIGCFKQNGGAKRLYERLGFKLIKETTNHYVLEM